MPTRREILRHSGAGIALTGGLVALRANPLRARTVDKLQVVTSSTGFLYATAYIAKQAGLFDEQDLSVDIFDGGGGSNAVAALVGGSADIGDVGIRNMSQAVSKGIDLKAVGTGTNGFPTALVVQPRIMQQAGLTAASSIKDKLAALKGKVIAVQDIGGSSGGFIRNLLISNGLPKDSITMIDMGSNAGQLVSLKARRIDGFVNGSPIWEVAVADGYGADLLLSSRDLPDLGDMAYIVQAVRGDTLRSKTDLVRRYLVGIRRAQILNRDDPDKAKKAYAAYVASLSSSEPLPLAVLDVMWSKNTGAIPAALAITPEALTLSRKFFDISDKLTDADLVDNTLAAQVTKAVG